MINKGGDKDDGERNFDGIKSLLIGSIYNVSFTYDKIWRRTPL
jgi:hypothetical protein